MLLRLISIHLISIDPNLSESDLIIVPGACPPVLFQLRESIFGKGTFDNRIGGAHTLIIYSVLSCSFLELTDFEQLTRSVTKDDTIVVISTNITFNSTVVISGVTGLELKSNASRGLVLLDGKGSIQLFNITHSDVVFRGIHFTNGYATEVCTNQISAYRRCSSSIKRPQRWIRVL